MKINIHIERFDLRLELEELLEIDALIKHLEHCKKQGATHVESTEDFTLDFYEIKPESDEDYDKRINREKHFKEELEKRELELYKSLKMKYEGLC